MKLPFLSLPTKLLGFDRVLRFSGCKLVLPFYHVVSNDLLSHISSLYSYKSVSEFENDLDFLLRYFEPTSLEDVNDVVKGNKILSKPSFHLTFDDGLREVYTQIFPVLKKKGIPASLFVNPTFVGNNALFYRYKVALLINDLENRVIKDFAGFPKDLLPTDYKTSTTLDWSNWLLTLKYHDTPQIDLLASHLKVDFDLCLKNSRPYLDFDELKYISLNGIQIGAHSMDHPLYSLISEEEQLRQTRESVAWVKEYFNPKVLAFAFPFSDDGVRKSFFDKLEKGNDSPDLIFGTAGLNREFRKNHLQRIAMENERKDASELVSNALVASELKKLIGKEYIVR